MPTGLPLEGGCTTVSSKYHRRLCNKRSPQPRALERWQTSDAVSQDMLWANQEWILPHKRIVQSTGPCALQTGHGARVIEDRHPGRPMSPGVRGEKTEVMARVIRETDWQNFTQVTGGSKTELIVSSNKRATIIVVCNNSFHFYKLPCSLFAYNYPHQRKQSSYPESCQDTVEGRCRSCSLLYPQCIGDTVSGTIQKH